VSSTSGLLVFAKTDECNRRLAQMVRDHDLERLYIAVVRGRVTGAHTVDVAIAGRPALTHLTFGEILGDCTVANARLETGRTHQIRIHCRHIGHPVLGDRRYGTPSPDDPPRLALHAERLHFIHPMTRETLDCHSPLAPDLATWLARRRTKNTPLMQGDSPSGNEPTRIDDTQEDQT